MKPVLSFLRPHWGFGAVALVTMLAVVVGVSNYRDNTRPLFVPPSAGSKGINRAIERCAAQGGEILLGAGIYLCDHPIIIRNSHVTLRGAGEATLLKLQDQANCPVLVIGDEANTPRRDVRGVCVSDLAIDGNRAAQKGECWGGVCDTGEKTSLRCSGIVVRRAQDVVVERVSTVRCRSAGVVTEKGCRRITIRSLNASDNEFDGLACYETEDSVFADLHLYDNQCAGISTDTRFNRNIIANAVLVHNGTQGIFMRDSHKNLLQGIVIRDAGKQGIFISQVDDQPATGPSGNTFVGLTVENSKGPAVRLDSTSCKHTMFTGCQFFDNDTGISEAAPGLAEVLSSRAR